MTLTILTIAEICTKYRITAAELARTTRQLNERTGEIYYTVTSRTNGPDHTVRARAHNARHILTCTCAAGQVGNTCWAMRASVAASFLYRQEENLQARREAEEAARKAESLRIQAQAQAIVDARMVELTEQRNEARAAVAGLPAGKNVRQAKAFSLLK